MKFISVKFAYYPFQNKGSFEIKQIENEHIEVKLCVLIM